MFAYCGNNPVNCYDPSGNYFGATSAQLQTVFFIAPGQRGTELGLVQQDAEMIVSIISTQQVLDVGLATIQTSGAIAMGVIYPTAKSITYSFDLLAVYDKCRFSGLGARISLTTAIVCAFVTNAPFSSNTSVEEFYKASGLNILSEGISNLVVSLFAPDANEAQQNCIQHISQKAAFVSVGGSMRYACMTDGLGDGISVRP